MKKIAILFFAIATIVACGSDALTEKVESKHPNEKPMLVGCYKKIDDKEVRVAEKHYYDNGKLKMEGNFENGKRTGIWKAYFNNGQLQSEGVFENGNREGVGKVYFPNGQLRYEGQYKDNKETGHWKFYNEKGKLVKEQDFN